MNWFERYGIPGAYFVGLMAGWAYAFYPDVLLNKQAYPGSQWLFALAAITFLPIGYIISIFGQVVYLNWRRCFARWRNLRRWLGFHGAAMDRLAREPEGFNCDEPNQDEAIIEARTLLLTASRNGALSVDTHLYIRNWIARRMDIVAINQSLIWATVFAGIFASVICGVRWVLIIISFAVIAVMILSIRVLRRQVIEVIAGIYRTYR